MAFSSRGDKMWNEMEREMEDMQRRMNMDMNIDLGHAHRHHGHTTSMEFDGFGGLGSTLKSLGKEAVGMYSEYHGQSGGGAGGGGGMSISFGGFKINPMSLMGGGGRCYQRGYTPRVSRTGEAEFRPSTIQDTGKGLAKSCDYIPKSMPMQPGGPQISTYANIRAQCLQAGKPWEDPDFRPVASSLYYSKPPSAWPNIHWKRPKDLCLNPQLFVDGGNRMDVIQGILGDCWLLAALASLSTNETLLSKVVPPDQSFDNTGIFRFNFWQYGRWVEVLIDDLLPTQNNKLIYLHSDTLNEFWSALLEKAYAKLNGSYEALSGGLTSEALTDFTGGFVERHDLGSKASPYLFSIMLKAHSKMALMGCSIDAVEGQVEAQLRNGLIAGHAYSITDVRLIPRTSGQIQMVRIRNPWGDSHEWNGAWSDKSSEWNAISDSEKQSIGLTFKNDGEFWMSYKDFVSNYKHLEICYLGPDDADEIEEMAQSTGKTKWEAMLFEGGWRRRVNAGGCRNHSITKQSLFLFQAFTGYEYQVSVIDPDPDDKDGNGMILVGLMQKERRKLKREGKDNLTIGYAIYKAPEQNTGTLDARFFQTHTSSAKSSAFINLREVTEHHKLPPGHYVIVPSTFEPDDEGEFILRIFTERKNNTIRELDHVTSVTDILPKDHMGGESAADIANKNAGMKAFEDKAGRDGEIDAFELQEILNRIFTREFRFDGFSTDMTRSLVAMRDADFTGKLGFENFKCLWSDLTMCRKTFVAMDTAKTGYFSSYELRTALSHLGFKVSNATFNAIVMRHSDKHGHIRFDDFVTLYVKLKTLFETFRKKDPGGVRRARFSLEEHAKFVKIFVAALR